MTYYNSFLIDCFPCFIIFNFKMGVLNSLLHYLSVACTTCVHVSAMEWLCRWNGVRFLWKPGSSDSLWPDATRTDSWTAQRHHCNIKHTCHSSCNTRHWTRGWWSRSTLPGENRQVARIKIYLWNTYIFFSGHFWNDVFSHTSWTTGVIIICQTYMYVTNFRWSPLLCIARVHALQWQHSIAVAS